MKTKLFLAMATLAAVTAALGAVHTVTEPKPEDADDNRELMRKLVWSLDAAATALGN